jgi:uncharacterized protein
MKRLIYYLFALFLPHVMSASDLTDAIENGQFDLARQLITNKHNINVQVAQGFTPLMLAAEKGQVDLCKLLITNGAVIDVKDMDGMTIIEILGGSAFPWLKPEVRKELLDLLKAAELKEKQQQGKVIVVDSNAVRDQLFKDERALAREALTNIDALNVDGKTILMKCAQDGNIEACKFLLDSGAKADIKDKDGKTALDYVCTNVKPPDEKLRANIIAVFKSFAATKPAQ